MLKNLPEPYQSIVPLPFNSHGWYVNQKPIERIFAENAIKTVVEIGSWLGLSTRHFASLLPEGGKIYAIDHWLGSVEHQKSPYLETAYPQFLSNIIHAGFAHKVVPMRMDSVEAARCLNCCPDLVYIDGSHEYEDVLADLAAWFPRSKIVCGDDWRWVTVRLAVLRFAEERNLRVLTDYNFWLLQSIQ
jgi:predicted O-methyltransferase YrrM